MKKPTIKDVARLAGVSFKTVSRVINNEPVVSDEVRQRVLGYIASLNYQPNMPARLMRKAPFSIAFVYDNPNSHYVIAMQNGILEACRTQGFELVIHPARSSSDQVGLELMTMIGSSQIGGIILTPPLSENAALVEYLVERNAKVVRIVSGAVAPDSVTPMVHVNDQQASEDMTRYLIELGHKNIAFVGGQPDHRSSRGRKEGFMHAMQTEQLAVNTALVREGEFTFDSGLALTAELLSATPRPSAIFAANDEIAAGALFAARAAGLDVPGDLSIAGFEDSPFSRQTWPRLTTVHQPNSKIACCAATMLIELMLAANDEKPDNIGFNLELVIRDSTVAPAVK